MAEPAIRLEGVSKRYAGQGGAAALDDVSLSVPAGCFLALVGGSGSGKTTLLKTINRLVEPDSGAVLIDGAPADAEPAHALRRRIGYVFQEVGLFPHLTVLENIGVTPTLLGGAPAEVEPWARRLLGLVALPPEFADRAPAALSGGQRQRVGLARALAANPAILLLDEPFGALDPVTREQLGDQVRSLHERMGLTTVMVTHDVAEAVLLADRIAVLEDGRLVAEGTAAELSAPDAPEAARELMAAPARQAKRLRTRLAGAAA